MCGVLAQGSEVRILFDCRLTSVVCPGGTSQCPDGETCCLLSSGQYGCCPFPDVRTCVFAVKLVVTLWHDTNTCFCSEFVCLPISWNLYKVDFTASVVLYHSYTALSIEKLFCYPFPELYSFFCLDRIWFVAETCWTNKPHAYFMLSGPGRKPYYVLSY